MLMMMLLIVLLLMVVVLLLLLMLWSLVTLNWLTMHLSNETTLSMDMVGHSTLMAIGVDQVVLPLSFVPLPRFLLTMNVSGVIIMDAIVILVVSWGVVLFLVMMLMLMLRLVGHLWLMMNLNLWLIVMLHLGLCYLALFWLEMNLSFMVLFLQMMPVVTNSTLSTHNGD